MRIIVLGVPGSGKLTQAKMLADRYRIAHISAGALASAALDQDANTAAAAETAALLSGQMVADEPMINLLVEQLRKRTTKRGFVIDGYPRNIPEAQSLDTVLDTLARPVQVAIYIQAEEDILLKRRRGQVNCEQCGREYNKYFSPPKSRRKCDDCGGKVLSGHRTTNKAVVERIKLDNENARPLIAYYKAQHKLRTLHAVADEQQMHVKICEMVDLEVHPLEINTLETAAESQDEQESTVIAGGQINRVPVSRKPAAAAPPQGEPRGEKNATE